MIRDVAFGKEVYMARFIPFILKTDDEQKIGVRITRMKKADAAQTEKEPVWQTSWMSAYIQKDAFEKYALKKESTLAGASIFLKSVLFVKFFDDAYANCKSVCKARLAYVVHGVVSRVQILGCVRIVSRNADA